MKLAIIILSGDTPEILFRCFAGIRENVKFEYKIYLAYNGRVAAVESQIRVHLEATFRAEQYKVVKYSFYNFAALNNDIVRNHLDQGFELLLFCNNDVVIHGDAVNQMVHQMSQNPKRFGTIGCRLLFENGLIQHDGQALSVWKDGTFRGVTHFNLYRDPATVILPMRLVIGNTFALCVSTLEVFKLVGGLNQIYKNCFEDVEYNLRCLLAGRINVTLESNHFSHHHESYSRKVSEATARVDPDDVKHLFAFINSRILVAAPLIVRTEQLPNDLPHDNVSYNTHKLKNADE